VSQTRNEIRVLGLSGSPNASSKTTLAIQAALDHATSFHAAFPEAERRGVHLTAQLLRLSELDLQFCDGRDLRDYTGDTRAVIEQIEAADALVLGSPVYRGSYTGRLKNVFDALPNDAMAGKPVGFVATGGTHHHYLALEHQLKPIAGFFNAYVVPGSVYASNEDFREGALGEECLHRLRQLGQTLVEFARRVPRDLVGGHDLGIKRVSLTQS